MSIRNQKFQRGDKVRFIGYGPEKSSLVMTKVGAIGEVVAVREPPQFPYKVAFEGWNENLSDAELEAQ